MAAATLKADVVVSKNDNSIFWLGKYLSLALTLPGSVLGGYILGALADHYLHIPFLRVAGIILGVIAGVVKIIQEVSRDT